MRKVAWTLVVALCAVAPAAAQDDDAEGRRQLIERRLHELQARRAGAVERGEEAQAARLAEEIHRLTAALQRLRQDAGGGVSDRHLELRTMLQQVEAQRAEALFYGDERAVQRLDGELEELRAQLAALGDHGPFPSDPQPVRPVEEVEGELAREAARLGEALQKAQARGRRDQAQALERRLDAVHGQLELLAAARQREDGERPGMVPPQPEEDHRLERLRRAFEETRRELEQARERGDREAVRELEQRLDGIKEKTGAVREQLAQRREGGPGTPAREERVRRALEDGRRRLAEARERGDPEAIHDAELNLHALEEKVAALKKDEARAREEREAHREERERARAEREEARAQRERERPADEAEAGDGRALKERLARMEEEVRRHVEQETRRIHEEAEARVRRVHEEARAKLQRAHEEARRRLARGDEERAREEARRKEEPRDDTAWRKRLDDRVERLERELREMRELLEEALRR